jgi:drug/metabolite transporter (DMT)-like permease
MALKLAASTSEVTNFMFLTPILTTVIAFVTMGELPPLVTYLGGGLMLAGLILTNLAVGKKEALAGVEAEAK